MAQRRMFSPSIVCSDAFLDMPASGRDLYFQLGMVADDDGFVNPRKIMRMLGSSEDDLKILIAKRFVLPFENGVVVIKHWKINNLIKPDRYHETIYTEQKALLTVKGNGGYTEVGFQNGSKLEPQVRLGKVRLGKETPSAPRKVMKTFNPLGSEIIKAFEEVDPKNKTYYSNTTQKNACDYLLDTYGLEAVLKRISILSRTNKLPYFPKIHSPYDLKEKWEKLQDTVEAKRAEIGSKKPLVI